MVNCIFCGRAITPNAQGVAHCSYDGCYTSSPGGVVGKGKIVSLDQVSEKETPRIKVGEPWDSAWGGGLVPGTTTLLAAVAGTGKTTGMLQLSSILALSSGKKAYYISAEQPAGEIRMMTSRLRIENVDRINVLKEFGQGAEIDAALLKAEPPAFMVLDSISAMFGKDNDGQVRTAKLYKKYAVDYNCPVVLLIHMNKQGDTAGLYRLHHDVDVVMSLGHLMADPRDVSAFFEAGYSEKEINVDQVRIVEAHKNRHGATNRMYYLQMTERGLLPLPPPKGRDEKKGKKLIALLPPPGGGEPAVVVERLKAPARDVVESLTMDGQKLVRKKGKSGDAKDRPARATAVEGEALKKKRSVMAKSKKSAKERAKRVQRSRKKAKT